ISGTMTRYEKAPSSAKPPATTSGTTNPPVAASIWPTKNVMQMPARLDAKFWMPLIDPTWRGVGAMSAGTDQMLAAANVRLPNESDKSATAQAALGTITARPML